MRYHNSRTFWILSSNNVSIDYFAILHKFVKRSEQQLDLFGVKTEIWNHTIKKLSELLNEQNNSSFCTPDTTQTINYPKDFFGYLQPNTLSDIYSITREDITEKKTRYKLTQGVESCFQLVSMWLSYFQDSETCVRTLTQFWMS